ncbi:putative L-asparaginase periplasmic precursor [Corynebacterium capitovis DSM 44611]|uniref:asparaginase n=1 Tax=Corynebacterium capitovis TaxID=131081 RepID=UPI00037AF22A|nr:asparaginase [Corynebacterium capitovis]WKD57377.1 putative L-asparaginase periplasmic precursor [Corynebacterium capitovis DSM 44611]
MTSPARPGTFVLVIATGGTIACTTDPATGARTPTLSAAELVTACGTTDEVRVYDATSLDSSSMTLADVDHLISLVHSALADVSVSGIVVTHGTDSMADTALALDLVHSDPRPVVLTGAQVPSDHPRADGPANLLHAITLAADPLSRGQGVMVSFGGDTLAARGAFKDDTSASRAFSLSAPMTLPRPRPVSPAPLADVCVPIVRAWPGAGSELIDAVASLGPAGIVVEALGAGNVSEGMGAALRRVLGGGTPVVISTSVPHGEVAFDYGGAGGGNTLGKLGAIPAGWLRAGQARIALATALATGSDPRALLGV